MRPEGKLLHEIHVAHQTGYDHIELPVDRPGIGKDP